MNDCLWRYIGVCDLDECKCNAYECINSDKASEIAERHTRYFDKQIRPIIQEFNEQYAEEYGWVFNRENYNGLKGDTN